MMKYNVKDLSSVAYKKDILGMFGHSLCKDFQIQVNLYRIVIKKY